MSFERSFESKSGVTWSGHEWLKKGFWAEALGDAEAMLHRDENHLGALEVKAQALLGMGNYAATLVAVKQLVRLNPHEATYELFRASALQSLGRYHEALSALGRGYAIARRPDTRQRISDEAEVLIHSMHFGIGDAQHLWQEAGITPPASPRYTPFSHSMIS